MNKSGGKRVLMLLENAGFPADVRVRHEATSLSSAGYRVFVICPAFKSSSWHQIVNKVEVYRYPTPPASGGLLGYFWEYGYSMLAIFLLSLFVWITRGFDIIHTAQPPDTFVFIAAFYKLLGKFYVLDLHDLSPELYYARFSGKGNSKLYSILIWVEGLAFRMADHVIATNHSYKEVALRRGLVEDHRITIVRNGPDMDELRNSNLGKAVGNEGKLIIGYVGVTGVQDGVDNLIRAVYRMVHDLGRTDFSCVVVGDGSGMPVLQSLVVELDIEQYVVLTGWVGSTAEVARYLDSMDICVAPEPSDPYNKRSTAIKIMEYMAAGKPIVSSDLPEHNFTAREAAIYARPNDDLDLAKKIVELMDDPAQREAMSKKGLDRIKTELSWPFQEKKLLQAYSSLAHTSSASLNRIEP